MKTGLNNTYVVADLPRAGLGNRLLVWAKALAFSKKNQLKLVVRGWEKVSIGPWLRREKIKRLYSGYFVNDDSTIQRLWEKFMQPQQILTDPAFDISKEELAKYRVIKFTALPHWSDYFKDIKNYRAEIKSALYRMLNPGLQKSLEGLPRPGIGVHIRMGDFRALKPGEDFSKVGAVRTPLEYFENCILAIRKFFDEELPVTIFSDGRIEELRPLLDLKDVELAPRQADIIDLLQLSRSRIIVTSTGSTFSYWAGFLSDAPIILHPDHIHESIRLHENDRTLYEGPVEGLPKELLFSSQHEASN